MFGSKTLETGLTERNDTLEDGEVYLCRNGKLERLPKSDDGLRDVSG